VRLATGLAGFVPILEYFTNAYDIALNTKEFLQDKKHWLSFFTSLRDVKG
jgi:hypothetical protein